MFDLISFLLGILTGTTLVGLFVLAFYLGGKSQEIKKSNIKRNIFGQVERAVIVKKLDDIDELLLSDDEE